MENKTKPTGKETAMREKLGAEDDANKHRTPANCEDIPVDDSIKTLEQDQAGEEPDKNVGSSANKDKVSIVDRVIALSRTKQEKKPSNPDNVQTEEEGIQSIEMDPSLTGGKLSEELKTAEVEAPVSEPEKQPAPHQKEQTHQSECEQKVEEVSSFNDDEDLGDLEEDIQKLKALKNDPHSLLPEEKKTKKKRPKKDKKYFSSTDKTAFKFKISEQSQSYLAVGIIAACFSVLFIYMLAVRPLQSKVQDLETRLNYRPPIMVMDLPSLVESVPDSDNFEEDVQERVNNLHQEVNRLRQAGILVLDSSAIMAVPDTFNYKFDAQ